MPTILLFFASGKSRWWSNWLNGARPPSGRATFVITSACRVVYTSGRPKTKPSCAMAFASCAVSLGAAGGADEGPGDEQVVSARDAIPSTRDLETSVMRPPRGG